MTQNQSPLRSFATQGSPEVAPESNHTRSKNGALRKRLVTPQRARELKRSPRVTLPSGLPVVWSARLS